MHRILLSAVCVGAAATNATFGALADRVHHLAAALERERVERAQWARARIELLSQFCAAGDGAPPAVQGLLRAAEASPPPPVPPPPPPALE